MALPDGRAGAFSAIGLVVIGEMCLHVGSSLAVLVFDEVGPLGMVMIRLVVSAVILMIVARPRLRGHDREAWAAVTVYGTTLAMMNATFYLALDRLPLGVTVTIEVLGPLTLSIVAARHRSAWVWALLALVGVVALGGGGWDRLDVLGVVFALTAAASWAFYILSAARVGRVFPKLDGLAVAMAIGAVLSLPFGIVDAGAALLRPDVLGVGAAVAVLSSTIPYAFELIALRRVHPSVFAVLMSMSPVVASLAGLVVLGQRLGLVELAGIASVVAAGVGAVLTGVAAGDTSEKREGEGSPPQTGSVPVSGGHEDALTGPTALVADVEGPWASLNGPLTGPIQIQGPPEDPDEPFAQPLA